MFHRRQLAFVVTVATLTTVVMLSLILDDDDEFRGIHAGMTYDAVVAVVGRTCDWSGSIDPYQPYFNMDPRMVLDAKTFESFVAWQGKEYHIFLALDPDHKVIDIARVACTPVPMLLPERTVWGRIRYWLGFDHVRRELISG